MSLVCFGSLVVYVLLEHTTVMLWQHGGVVVAERITGIPWQLDCVLLVRAYHLYVLAA
jgi:hypothetical protein